MKSSTRPGRHLPLRSRPRRWVIVGASEHASRICEVLGDATDDTGKKKVRVRFVGQQDFWTLEEALVSPRQLRRAKAPAKKRCLKRKKRRCRI